MIGAATLSLRILPAKAPAARTPPDWPCTTARRDVVAARNDPPDRRQTPTRTASARATARRALPDRPPRPGRTPPGVHSTQRSRLTAVPPSPPEPPGQASHCAGASLRSPVGLGQAANSATRRAKTPRPSRYYGRDPTPSGASSLSVLSRCRTPPPPTAASSRASPPRPPVSCISAAPARRCSTGYMHAIRVGSSLFASRTPIASARPKPPSPRSSRAWTGWAWSDEEGRSSTPAPAPRRGRAADAGRGRAYRCWMTVEELEVAREKARAEGNAIRSPWRDAPRAICRSRT
jgi:hypothetical protein